MSPGSRPPSLGAAVMTYRQRHVINFTVRTTTTTPTTTTTLAWTADVACPIACQPIWPACWLNTPDKSSSSSSRLVQNVWDFYRDELGVVPNDVVLALRDAVSRSSVDDFRSIWSS